MAITVEPLGGLGNQLFHYALGRSLAQRLDVDLEVDRVNFIGYEWHSYELDSFSNAIAREYSSGERVSDRLLRGVEKRMNKTSLGRTLQRNMSATFIERGWRFDPSVLSAKDGVRLRGYFQSWRYFDDCAQILRNEITAIPAPTQWFREMARTLAGVPNWISVHVRRGNYVQLPNMGLAEDVYYERAMELMERLVGPMTVVVFSDDPETARKLPTLAARPDMIYVKPAHNSRPIESMVLMSMSSHAILANSTFSWWASWLADGRDRVVICPRPWLDTHDYDDRDLLLPDWITVGR